MDQILKNYLPGTAQLLRHDSNGCIHVRSHASFHECRSKRRSCNSSACIGRCSVCHCIFASRYCVRDVVPRTREMFEGIEMQERRQFFEWGSHESRREVLQQLLPWLQLRAIILYYFLSCFGDSSKVSTAETAELHVQMS